MHNDITISGSVVNVGSLLPEGGLRVEAWDKDLLFDDFLGEAVTDERGQFEIRIRAERFREGVFDRDPDLYFKVYRDKSLLCATEDSVLWNVHCGRTRISIPVPPPASDAPEERAPSVTYRVSGRVTSRTSAAVGGLRVRVVDKAVGGDMELGSALTTADGGYRVSFVDAGVRARGKALPDLQVQVFAEGRRLASSAIAYAVSSDAAIDIRLDDSAKPLLRSEYEALLSAVRPHVAGGLGELEESLERQDISYLANTSGWDARAIAFASLAERLHAQSGGEAIAAPFFYALLRSGASADPQQIFRTRLDAVEAAWKRAVEARIIAPALAQQIPVALAAFERQAVRHALDTPLGSSTLREVAAVSLGDDRQRQETLAVLHARHGADPAVFWERVQESLGADAAARLRVDGKLARLTTRNARLMQRLHDDAGQAGLSDPRELVINGFHEPERWLPLLDGVVVPQALEGASEADRRRRYAESMAAELRLSYPTTVLAVGVSQGQTPLRDADNRDAVGAFLFEHQGAFDIAREPIRRFLARSELSVPQALFGELERLQRVYQITPGDSAMRALLARGVDSADKVCRYGADFVRLFAQEVGGTEAARAIQNKARQVRNATLNLLTSYAAASSAPPIGVHSPPAVIDPSPGDVIAIPTLETLVDEIDYCACEHCRSVLSPAAYLVDLLHFLDRDPEVWADLTRSWALDHGGAPYPFVRVEDWDSFRSGASADEIARHTDHTPLEILLSRVPHIQHIPLTCENTHTPLPYIDLVNEMLEYCVVHDLSLAGFEGNPTDPDAPPELLLAAPEHVDSAAYDLLAAEPFPSPLPFDRSLERVRRYFARFDLPLERAMQSLRTGDDVERTAPGGYAWRDIWMEELRLSRSEYALLTDGTTSLQALYGLPAGSTESEAIEALSGAKAFCRRMDISLEELEAILETEFVNPSSTLVPRLQRLGVSFAMMRRLRNEPAFEPEFVAALAPGLGPQAYGGDIVGWVRDEDNYRRIMSLITLTSRSEPERSCDFDALEIRYADPDRADERLRAIDFVRLSRFIRLWRKLGWSIARTDQAIVGLYPIESDSESDSGLGELEQLDAAFLTLLPRLGVVKRLSTELRLDSERDLPSLLACFSPIGTHGVDCLYRRMFPASSLPAGSPFADDGYGRFLTGPDDLLPQAEVLRGTFQLSGRELSEIVEALGYGASEPLGAEPVAGARFARRTERISAIYRRGWLARALGLGVEELLALLRVTGLDPFVAPDPGWPPVLRLWQLVQELRAGGLQPGLALYLLWDVDPQGDFAVEDATLSRLARTLRADFGAIEAAFAVPPEPSFEDLESRTALVYGAEAAETFFAMLAGSVVLDVPYTQVAETLGASVTAVAPGLDYDRFAHRLVHSGLLSSQTRDDLVALGVGAAFDDAVAALRSRSEELQGAFFLRFPELEPIYADYAASSAPEAEARGELAASLTALLSRRRKRQQAFERLGTEADVDASVAATLFSSAEPSSGRFALHAAHDAARPALADVMALDERGLALELFAGATATGVAYESVGASASLDYTRASNRLPPPSSGDLLSAVWRGALEVPESGYHNLVVETESGAVVTIELDGAALALVSSDGVWRNAGPLELATDRFHEVRISVEGVRERVAIKWEGPTRAREVVPGRYLYPPAVVLAFADSFVRFAKVATVGARLRLTAAELVQLGFDAQLGIGGQGWLNALARAGDPAGYVNADLLAALEAALDCAAVKRACGDRGGQLLALVQDPSAVAAPVAALASLLGCTPQALEALLTHLGLNVADLAHAPSLRRLHAALATAQQLAVEPTALLQATTNRPDDDSATQLEDALRARYDASAWLEIIRPINDELRGLQRDALVAYVLQRMSLSPETAHIDTPEKLFEYRLMDVEMAPCMQTSRIRHALSSVQLFIERCILGLEPRVAPDMIDREQWAWMNRYRIWEANRKVLLFPENWLEPEFRTTQSPIFREVMGELLQGDVTDAAASEAFTNYLSKLEELSQLEPCGVCRDDAPDLGSATHPVEHLVARTAGANRQYYYRRFEFGTWSPWEKIPHAIEDDPVLPVVWKGRLLLFWLRLIEDVSLASPELSDGPVTEVSASAAGDPPRPSRRALLCWSEYVDSQWQPVRTSDVAAPLDLGRGSVQRLGLAAWDQPERHALEVVILGYGFPIAGASFRGTQGLPVKLEPMLAAARHFSELLKERILLLQGGETSLRAYHLRLAGGSGLSLEQAFYVGAFLPFVPGLSLANFHTILSAEEERAARLGQNVAERWDDAFYYSDSRHTFRVTPSSRSVHVQDEPAYLVDDYDFRGLTEVNLIVRGAAEAARTLRPEVGPQLLGAEQIGTERITRLLPAAEPVRFGDVFIGPAGAVGRLQN